MHTCTSLLQMILHIFKPHRMCCRSEEVDRFALNKLMNHIVFIFWVPRNLNILIHNELFLIDICQIHSGVWELGVSFRTRACVSSLLPCERNDGVFFFHRGSFFVSFETYSWQLCLLSSHPYIYFTLLFTYYFI